jgi:hypothetical protein
MLRWCLVLMLVVSLGACGDDDAPVGFTLEASPEFVQGVIPGAHTGILVTVRNDAPTDEPVSLSVTATGATAAPVPEVAAGEVAEVWVTPDAGLPDEAVVEIVVTGTRDGFESTVTRSATVFAWEDDREEYARVLLGVFTPWLAANRPDLGITPDSEFDGSLVAPQLLVVSHYLFLSEEWEMGLAWHVMIPPDDWAEIYLRPRDGAAPTLAFRLSSQAAALDNGVVEIAPVMVPAEVVR